MAWTSATTGSATSRAATTERLVRSCSSSAKIRKPGERSLDLLRWGFVSRWSEAKPKLRPINAKAETVASVRLFADAFARRRCIVPVDGFFEWRSKSGARQPYAIAMRDHAPFGLAALWDNWRDPLTGEWVRTFTIITVPANSLIATIHDRMPAILRPEDYERWLGPEPHPRDVLVPFPSEPITLWPVSTRVNAAREDDPTLIEPVDLAQSA